MFSSVLCASSLIFITAFFIDLCLTDDSHISPKNQATDHISNQGSHHIVHQANHHQSAQTTLLFGIVVYAFITSGIILIALALSHIQGTNLSSLSSNCAFAGCVRFNSILSILSFSCHLFLASL